MRRLWVLLLAAIVTGCTASAPHISSRRFPTRVPPTATPLPTASPVAARSYYEQGLARQAAGDAAGALQSFTWAIQRAPDFALAYVARGTVYLAQGKPRAALSDAEAALKVDPDVAMAHALRGEALRLLGRTRRALEAFDQAVALSPDLKPDTFRSRWLAARTAHNVDRLPALSSEYASAHPDDPLRYYYQGWGFIARDKPRLAIRTLVRAIEATPDPPAALWFALGQAYAADEAWPQAVISLEAARQLMQAGDITLRVHSDQPIAAIFSALGRAYLGAGRCVDAETMLEYALEVGAPASEYGPSLEEARFCQTPTPTASPYPTATPLIW